MPNVWVFPGGAVDPEDGEGEAGRRACAVRELAEEAGIELPAIRSWSSSRAGSRPRLSRAASTPGSSSPSRLHTRRPSPTASRRPRRRWFEPRRRLRPRPRASWPSPSRPSEQLESLLPFGSAEEALSAHRGRDGRADPAEGDRHSGEPPRRPSRRSRLPDVKSQLSAGRAPGRRARGRAGRCGCRSPPSRPAGA